MGDYGDALGPPEGDWSEVLGIFKRAFSTVHTIQLSPPYLIARFVELPPSPWPFTIGGLPLRFTDSEHCWKYRVMRSQRRYLKGLIDDIDDADDEY